MAQSGASLEPSETSAQLTTAAHPLIGIVLKLLSTFVFSLMIVCLKYAAARVPIGEVVFARNFFGIFPVLIMVTVRGELPVALHTYRPAGHFMRAIVGISAMLASFTAYKLLPLPDATAIGFASPLVVVVLAFFLLGETVRIYRWSAVIIGFFGILIILSPHLGAGDMDGASLFGALCASVGAVFTALAMIFVRRLCETERTATIVTWFSGSAALFSLVTFPFGWINPEWAWVVPEWETAGLLLLVGLLGGVGQILMTQSYRYADASTIAPFDYANMIWAVILGWFLFSEVPVPEVLIGGAIVIGAGIFVIYREHRLGLDRTKARRASTPSKS